MQTTFKWIFTAYIRKLHEKEEEENITFPTPKIEK